jgi:formylglycine-generating enzyme required for sulfatase activity
MIHITGVFSMGCDPDHNGGLPCPPEELPLHSSGTHDFFIEAYEVTNGQYSECVAGAACTAPPVSTVAHQWYYGNPLYLDYPVVHVSWTQANDYCLWAGRRLPTEREWEMTARGNQDTRPFPWGDSPLPKYHCDYANSFFCSNDPLAVGSSPGGVSPAGAYDMLGNVEEWVYDWFDPNWYSVPLGNPSGPATGTAKIYRGGSWSTDEYLTRISARHGDIYWNDNNMNLNIGFRCASDTSH